MAAPTYALAIDFDRDELFAASEAKTGDVVSEGGRAGEVLFEYTRGHDIAKVLSQPRAGAGSFLLDNAGGDYSIGTTLAAGQAVRLRGAFGGTTYDLVRAILDQPVQSPIGTGRALVRCPLLGPLSRLAGKKVSTALYASVTTGVAIGHLLDAAGYAKNVGEYLVDTLGAVAYWKLNETSGAVATASAGAANGTYVGSPTLDAADLDDEGNGAPDFNGTTQYVSGSDAALPAGAAARSILLRVNLDVVNVTDQPLFSYGSAVGSQGILIEANNANVRVGKYGANASASTGSIAASTKTTILVTISAAGAITYYLQGVAAGTATLAGINTVLNQFRIADAIAGWGLPSTMNGRGGHVAVFNRVLTPAEAAASHARFEDAPRHLDAGQTTLDWWWLDNEDAMGALVALKATEGPGCAVYEDGTGALVFKGRHARLLDARSTAIQTTFRTAAGATEPLASLPFEYDPGTRDVVNQVTTTVKRRALGAAGYRWQSQLPYATLAPGESKQIAVKLDDPGSGFVTGLLTTNPTYASTLAAAIANGTDLTFTIPTGEATMITTNAIIDIEGEYMVVSGRTTGSPNDTITVTARGNYGTTAASHLISTAVRTRAFVANAASAFTSTNLTGNITVTLDRTSGQTATFTFTNTGGTLAYLFARLYGQLAAVQETYDVASTIDAAASQAAYGVRTFPLPIRAEIAVNTAQDLCNAIVGYQQDGRATARVAVKGIQHADRLTAALAREISDRVRLIHAGSGVDAEMYVESITHRVIAPASHVTTFACEEAAAASYFRWGVSTWGSVDVWGF